MNKIFTPNRFLALIIALFAVGQVHAQAFTISPSANATAQLEAGSYAATQIDFNNNSGAPMLLEWETVTDQMNPAWDITFCDYQACYSGLIAGRVMDTIPTAGFGLIRISVDATAGEEGVGYCEFDVWVKDDKAATVQRVRFDFDVLANVQGEKARANFDLFPNPVHSSLEIRLPEGPAGTLTLMDVTGRELLSTTTRMGNTTVDVSTLPTGTYLARMQRSDAVVTKKFVKVH